MIIRCASMRLSFEAAQNETTKVAVVTIIVSFEKLTNAFFTSVSLSMDAAAVYPRRIMVVNDRVGEAKDVILLVKDTLKIAH